jgi:hypothetical protein
VKLKRQLTKQEKAIEKRFWKLCRKPDLTEVEEAELRALGQKRRADPRAMQRDDCRHEELFGKSNLTEAEEAERGAVVRATLYTHPELFTHLPDGKWALNDWLSKSKH